MKPLRAGALALLLPLAVLTGTPSVASAQEPPPPDAWDSAQYAPADDAPDPAQYQHALSSYGRWISAPPYGVVWQPAVSYGWQPYVQGYWAWSPYGWTWVSAEPWSWTFHYGRWTLLPTGWVWVPGSVWGPAWVDWYYDDGFVGWAPLTPFGTHVTVINSFVFVRSNDFCSRRLRYATVDWRHVPDR